MYFTKSVIHYRKFVYVILLHNVPWKNLKQWYLVRSSAMIYVIKKIIPHRFTVKLHTQNNNAQQ